MRLIIFSTIDQGTVPGDHLDHRHVITLSKGVGCKVDGAELILGIDQGIGTCLTRQINIGFQTKIKNLLIFTEIFRSDQIRHLHQRIVTGIFQRLLNCLHTMSCSLDTADMMSGNSLSTIAVKCLISGQCPRLQPGCHRKWFCSRSRLIGGGHAEIVPHLIQ